LGGPCARYRWTVGGLYLLIQAGTGGEPHTQDDALRCLCALPSLTHSICRWAYCWGTVGGR